MRDHIEGVLEQDNSHEGTARRILSMSTDFFEVYAARYPDSVRRTCKYSPVQVEK